MVDSRDVKASASVLKANPLRSGDAKLRDSLSGVSRAATGVNPKGDGDGALANGNGTKEVTHAESAP
jgi:hypothetical protein